MPRPEENPVSSAMRQIRQLSQDQHDLGVSVPTFRDRRLLQYIEYGENEQATDAADAFLHYSDDEVRMRTLSGGIRGAAHQSTAPECIRKTRISFELHPSVFFDDLLDDESFLHIDEDVVKNANPQVAALISLFGEEELQANIRTPRAA
jgi:hypothetical protein